MIAAPWEKRIARAAELEKACPPAAELLRFYRHIAEFLATVSQPVQLEPLLRLVAREGPDALAQVAEALLATPVRWSEAVQAPATPAESFFPRVIQQANQEALARRNSVLRDSVQPICPFCGSKPLVAILRPEGEGGKRSLLCGVCFTEWDFRRLFCPNCGEEDKDKLPVYTAQEFPHIRVEACDSCRVYIKSVDLTRNGLAVPEVDELASIALDLWAAENGYTKLQTNLFAL